MKKFMIIWIGQLISSIGSGMTAFAVSIYVYQLTGSAAWVSAAALLSYLPAVLLNPAGNINMIVVFCTLFFTALPFVNTCADVLIRVRIPNNVQGRVWGMISVLTQAGYVAAYAVCGALADYVFGPMLMEDGILAGSVGRIIGTGEGRGIGFMLIITGIIMFAFAFIFSSGKSIKEMERSTYELVNYKK